jgi:hypothetical protein
MLHVPLPTLPPLARGFWLLLFLTSLLPLGCSSDPALPPLAPVKGKVTLDGKALTAGNVVLHPVNLDKAAKALSASQIDASGNYEIHTGGKAGAPLNKYKIVVTPAMMPAEGGKGGMSSPFDTKFGDPKKTTLEFEVIDGAAEGRYDLKLTK